MKKNKASPLYLSFLLALSLVVSFTLISFASCSSFGDGGSDSLPASDNSECSFTFKVSFPDGTSETYEITTTRTFLRDALEDENLIAGDESAFGLYVKTVGGVTLDYTRDGKYWALYETAPYALSGVDTTRIQQGAEYEFRAE